MRKIFLCLALLLIVFGFAGCFAFRTLTKNPLLDACKELKPGMTEAEAFATIEKNRSGPHFRYIGAEGMTNTPGKKDLGWIDFPLGADGIGTNRFKTPDWFPVSIEYRNDRGLSVWFCDGAICEEGTNYQYTKSLIVEVPVPRGIADITLYEDFGLYHLRDNCGPKK